VFTSVDQTRLERMRALKERAEACTRCNLSSSGSSVVVGSGSLDAAIVLVGEAPGRKEDESGLPFVGSAGKLLDRLLEASGLRREEVFIMNIVKCRPPRNRRPKKDEVEACRSYLEEQLDILRPRVIAPMGNSSLSYFLGRYGLESAVIGDVHGVPLSVQEKWGAVTLMPLYHPAAAIYNRKLLQDLEEDMKKLPRL
jgi:uracil-DNA glycosylase family 4